MSRHKADPTYRLHKRSGQAIVTLSGRMIYLGTFGSPESREKYHAALTEWHQRGCTLSQTPRGAAITIGQLALAYLGHADAYYQRDGAPTGEADTIRHALRPLNRLYCNMPATDFSPLKLQTVRAEMVRLRWVRTYVNRQVGRIRRMFKWGAQSELVPVSVWQSLSTVEGLREGRTPGLAESVPVTPVPQPKIEAVLPLVSPQVRAMIELQLLTGMRPGEVCAMRGMDVDMTPDEHGTWRYRPATHKNAYRGHQRAVPLGPKAQAIVQQWLTEDPGTYLFSPAAAEAARLAARMEARQTRRQPSQLKRAARRAKRRQRRPAGPCYTVTSYRRAIAYACDKAFALSADLLDLKREVAGWVEVFRQKAGRRPRRDELPKDLQDKREAIEDHLSSHRWHPNQLRHNHATVVRRGWSWDAARAVLGHKSIAATQIYAEKFETDLKLAAQVAAMVG